MDILTTSDLQKNYSGKWALKGCTISIPSGAVVALVGSNGAGKTTLLDIVAGLLPPTSGEVRLFESVKPGSLEALQRIGFVAQNAPLNKNLTVISTINLVQSLNGLFDRGYALGRLRNLHIPLKCRIGKLSGGQQSQVALTLAIARRPDLLLLDEPLASLDSLARQQFLMELMSAVATTEMSVIFSSHSITELEKVCDYLILICNGEIQLSDSLDHIIGSHSVIACAPTELDGRDDIDIIDRNLNVRFANHLVRISDPKSISDFDGHAASLESIVLAYLRRAQEIDSLQESIRQ
ncbi:MAG TPA: ABC transporter ATP-binding protein [archaeon]|nr:ABC transporter ATP-binding protein [archaeon]